MLPRPGSAASDPHPFPAGVVKLQDDVNSGLLPWPSEAAAALGKVSSSSEPPVQRAEAASVPKRLQPRSWPHGRKAPPPEGRTRCVCLINSSHSTGFAFTQSWGMEAPNSTTTHQWLGLSSSHCWNPAPGLRARTAATAGRVPGTQLAALHEARGACCSPRGWRSARGGCLR